MSKSYYTRKNKSRGHKIRKRISTLKRNVKKPKSFKKLNCSAGRNINTYTCYTKTSLDKIKSLWNKRHKDSLIETNNSKEIWLELKNKLSSLCNSERCWIKQKFMENNLDNELLNYTHAPNSPKIWEKNPNEWLNSNDIINVMKQYEMEYINYEFIGPSPIDFDKELLYGECIWNELCNLNIANFIKNGKTKIGIIFNTDPHNKTGSHWISLFIDIPRHFIFYFDSNGDDMPKEVKTLVDRIIKQGIPLNIDFDLFYNVKEHQYSNTECGMYSLYFLNQMITTNKTPQEFNKNRIPDKHVEELRKIYFNG